MRSIEFVIRDERKGMVVAVGPVSWINTLDVNFAQSILLVEDGDMKNLIYMSIDLIISNRILRKTRRITVKSRERD